MTTETPLWERMVAKADADSLAGDHPLRTLAAPLQTAAEGFYGQPQTVNVARFMGCWARARKVWCDYTGEPLI